MIKTYKILENVLTNSYLNENNIKLLITKNLNNLKKGFPDYDTHKKFFEDLVEKTMRTDPHKGTIFYEAIKCWAEERDYDEIPSQTGSVTKNVPYVSKCKKSRIGDKSNSI